VPAMAGRAPIGLFNATAPAIGCGRRAQALLPWLPLEKVRFQFHSLRQSSREVILWATDVGQKKRKIGADLVR
jgi:hypothetical protein